MNQAFIEYSAISARALEFNPRAQDVITKKQEILTSIDAYYKKSPNTILFYGFSSLLLASTVKEIYVTAISEKIKNLLDTSGVKYTYIGTDQLGSYKKKFDWVVASDEFFTFADTEDQQREIIAHTTSLANDLVITTLRDYKNQDYKDKEFSQPLSVYNGQANKIFLEYHHYNYNDKNAWTTSVYELEGTSTSLYGPFNRRSMFFKQLAKFSLDAGARNFYVHKNLMYKSLIKKNYEHVISIAL